MVPPILIVGVGNLLLRDEGIGVHVAHELQRRHLPTDLEVLDGGTAGMDLLHHFQGRRRVIFVDAVEADGEGIYRRTADDAYGGGAWGLRGRGFLR